MNSMFKLKITSDLKFMIFAKIIVLQHVDMLFLLTVLKLAFFAPGVNMAFGALLLSSRTIKNTDRKQPMQNK